MTIKAGDWQTLWDRMDDDAPCDGWRLYIETFEDVSTMLDAARKREVRNENVGVDQRPTFYPYCLNGESCCYGMDEDDAYTFADFLTKLTGLDNPTNEQVLAVLRERYEDK